MKKVAALSLISSSYLLSATQVFASTGDINIGFCGKAGSRFSTLCNLGSGNVGSLVESVVQILFIVAVIVALGFLIYGGIKWIISGGDKTKVEAARGTIVAALVGLVLVFLAYFIMNLIFNFFGVTTGGTLTIPSLGL